AKVSHPCTAEVRRVSPKERCLHVRCVAEPLPWAKPPSRGWIKRPGSERAASSRAERRTGAGGAAPLTRRTYEPLTRRGDLRQRWSIESLVCLETRPCFSFRTDGSASAGVDSRRAHAVRL